MRIRFGTIVLLAISIYCDCAIGQSTHVDSAPAGSHLTPYTAFAWSAPGLGGPAHISPMIWIESRSMPGLVARQLEALPAGKRVCFVWHAQEQIWGDPRDFVPLTAADLATKTTSATVQSPWLHHGAAARAAWFGPWLDGVKKVTNIDFLVTDAEVNLSMWAIQPPQVRAIGADPRYPAVAKQFGITDLSQVGALQYWNVCAAWNDAMSSTIASYFHAAYADPLLVHFPDAGYSEYNDMLLPPALAARARDLNGWAQSSAGPLYGTHQSPPIYGQIRQLAITNRNDGTNPDFAKDPLATIAWQAGVMRALVVASHRPILPWFCYRSWRGDNAGSTPLAGTPYWEELVYHCMLSGGCVDCLFWDPKAPPSDVNAMNAVLATLQAQTKNSPTLQPLTNDAVPFNSSTIVSGAKCADGRKVFRVTAMPGATSAVVTIPGEREPRHITIPSNQAGAWITDP